MTEYASSGDHQRTMALLWGTHEPPARGPKQALSVEQIVAAAVEIADADGLAGLSMRKVAERLGKGTMSLYTYIPGKSELLDLMLDRVLAEVPADAAPDGWRAAAEAAARAELAFYDRHPWVLQVARSRAVLGPNEMDAYESMLRIYDDIGLTALEVARAASAVSGYVRGAAKEIAEARAAEAATGMSDDQWWEARSPLYEELSGDQWAERWPTATKLQEANAFDQLDRSPDDDTPYVTREAIDAFEFGLARLLDGIEVLVERRRDGTR